MFNVLFIKATILCIILLLASIQDIKSHEVSDFYHVLIVATALIGISLPQLPGMLIGAFFITLPVLIVEIRHPGGIGGADIKLTAACTFFLGIQRGLVFLLIGLILAVVSNRIINAVMKTRYKEPFALVPYLSVGCMVAYLV
jgi:leader peptidase (prepilin peptidase)/N-methyltransferase